MASTHLFALKKKKENLERDIRSEMSHPAHDHFMIRRLKEEKLHLKEQIERLERHAE